MTVREAAPGKTARTRSRDQGRGRSDATNTVATRGRETLKNTSTARGARRSRTVSRTGVAGLNGFARDARWWSSSWAPIEFELARVRAVKAARNRKPLKRKRHVPRRRPRQGLFDAVPPPNPSGEGGAGRPGRSTQVGRVGEAAPARSASVERGFRFPSGSRDTGTVLGSRRAGRVADTLWRGFGRITALLPCW